MASVSNLLAKAGVRSAGIGAAGAGLADLVAHLHEGTEHEELAVRRGARSGALMAVSVHSTLLGPGLGGARMWEYSNEREAIEDAQRLAAAMTMKAAAAGLDLGGAKGVIMRPPGPIPQRRRRALMHDFGDLVESLAGRYITAEDVGTGPQDMVAIAERTSHVVGQPRDSGGSGDPSPVTALGVQAAIRGCCEFRFASPRLEGARVTVIGLGHVGAPLAQALALAGADLAVSDIDEDRRTFAERIGARWLDPAAALLEPCDVLAPCALGGVIDEQAAERLRCAVVCGAANNVLTGDGVAERLAARGVVYAPDFIANAGGLISVYGELNGYGARRATRLAEGIEQTMRSVLEQARRRGITPLEAARERAQSRLVDAALRADRELRSA